MNKKEIIMNFDEYDCALIIASALINLCILNKIEINTSKLMKLLYFMQKEHILKYNKLIFTDKMLTSSTGPFIPVVYEYYQYGSLGFYEYDDLNKTSLLLESHKDIAKKVLEEYGAYTPSELVEISLKDPFYIDLKYKDYNNINDYLITHKKDIKKLKLKND